MNSELKNPNELTRDELYGLIRKWVIKELELREVDLNRASDLARSVLEHLEKNLAETTPFNALANLSKEFPEVFDITLHQYEQIYHEEDLKTVEHIKECIKKGEFSEIKKLEN